MSALKTLYRNILGSRAAGIRLLLPLLGLTVACGVALSARTGSQPARVLDLTARDMAFYLAGDPTPNPTLVVHRGEKVRLKLTNQDGGMTHDFAVESLDLATRALRRDGTDSLTFEAPEHPGESEYVCTFHARMMKGVLKVE